ncbi:MAG: amidohydrolase family protein, partial [Terriglobales bacterium]
MSASVFSGASAQTLELQHEKGDLALIGGEVYTVNNNRTWAEAVVIREGHIIYVGTDRGAQAYIGSGTHVQELGGRLVLPGFHDSHVHLTDGGVHLGECQLENGATKEEVLAIVRKYAAERPHDQWLQGAGWSLPLFADANPQKDDLDKIVPDRPVY